MAVHHVRFPFEMPYGYAEIEHDTATDGPLDDMILAEYAQAAISAEAALVAAGGGHRTGALVGAAIAHGATPYTAGPGGVPTMAAPPGTVAPPPQPAATTPYYPPQPPPPPPQAPEACPECGWAGVVKTTPKGRVLECSNPNHRNERGYAATIRWIDQPRRGR